MDEPSSNRIEDLIRERLRLDQELDRFQRLLTILYVDIVGSTRFYDEHGNTAGLLMVQKCLDVLIPIVQEQRGIVVKTIGDAILARFDAVEDALRSGLQMVRSLEARNRGKARSEELHIHVGINSGLCLLKDNDVFGDVVNVAARIESQAGIDEIVVSPSVYEQVRSQQEFHIRKKSSGVELKGKSSKLDLYTVVWKSEETVDTPPPPPSADQLVLSTGVHANFAELAKRLGQEPMASATPAAATRSLQKPARYSLARVRVDGTLDKPFVLDRPVITAGRTGDIVLDGDPLVAAEHVRFTQLGDQVFVEDLGSPRGVYLRLRAPHALENGDVLQIGGQLLRFVLQPSPSPIRTAGGVAGTAPRACLTAGGNAGQELARYELHSPETVLGRSQGSYTFPEDFFLSSRHARVYFRDGKYFLEDLGSTNGTFLKIRKGAFAREGDVILVGAQQLHLQLERATTPSI